MRKITELAVNAFNLGENFTLSNTRIECSSNIKKMYLFNNLIAKKEGALVSISGAGWYSNTTKERLNGFLINYGLYIKQRNFAWFLCDKNNIIPFIKGNSLNGIFIF